MGRGSGIDFMYTPVKPFKSVSIGLSFLNHRKLCSPILWKQPNSREGDCNLGSLSNSTLDLANLPTSSMPEFSAVVFLEV